MIVIDKMQLIGLSLPLASCWWMWSRFLYVLKTFIFSSASTAEFIFSIGIVLYRQKFLLSDSVLLHAVKEFLSHTVHTRTNSLSNTKCCCRKGFAGPMFRSLSKFPAQPCRFQPWTQLHVLSTEQNLPTCQQTLDTSINLLVLSLELRLLMDRLVR